MNFKRFKFYFIIFLAIIIFGNSFFIMEGFAISYSDPSTTPLWSYSIGEQAVSAVAISSDGTYITATSDNLITNISMKANGKLYLFNKSISNNKIPLWNYSIVNDFSSLAISGDGSYIVAGGGDFDQKVYLFNNSNPTPRWTYDTDAWVYDVAISDNGKYIFAACGICKKLFLFNNTEPSPILGFSTSGLTLRVAISSNGSYMTVIDNAVKLYFFNTSNISPEWTFNLAEYSPLSISADGNYIVSGGRNVYFFKKNSSIPIWTYQTSDTVNSIKISRDGNYIVAGGGYSDYNVYFFNRLNSTPEWIYSTRGEIASVDISFNGDYIVAHSYDNYVYLFNKNNSTPIWRYKLDGYFAHSNDNSLEISSDGKYIIAGGRHYIYLFDRDKIAITKLIIPGYNLFVTFLMIGIMLLSSLIAIFRRYKKVERNLSN